MILLISVWCASCAIPPLPIIISITLQQSVMNATDSYSYHLSCCKHIPRVCQAAVADVEPGCRPSVVA